MTTKMPTEIELAGGRSGRIFFEAGHAPASLDTVREQLERLFVEEDDRPRLELLGQALENRVLEVDTFPSEDGTPFIHAYVRAPQVSGSPLFACVVAPMSAVQQLLAAPPHFVFETATFQCVEGVGMPRGAQVVTAIDVWARRVWPGRAVPRVVVHPWLERGDIDLDATALPGLRAA